MTTEAAIGKAVHAALGLACARLASLVLPWSNRSQHDAYLHGLREGGMDGFERGVLAGRAEVLNALRDRVAYHHDLACDAEIGDMAAANHAVIRYSHVLRLIGDLREEMFGLGRQEAQR